jgi:type I restriction enzyme S subunit
MVSGYKQTDIGLIPLDWEVKKLGAVTDVIGGGTPSTSIKEYWNGNINWFTPTEISEIKYSYSSKRKITSLGLNNSSARMLPIGTVLLTSRAGIGDLSILGTESSTNQGFQSLVTKKEINNEFLYYLMKTKKNVLLEYASGSTFLEISPKNLKSIQIPLPPLPEQEAIAEVLSDTDTLITALEKRIAKKRNMKQGSMQKLLSPKDDWEVKKLGKIAEIRKGSALSKNKLSDNGKYSCLLYGELFTTYKEVINRVVSKTNYEEGIKSKYGDILFPGSTTTSGIDLAKASALLFKNILLGGDIIIVRNQIGYNSEFVSYFLNQINRNEIAKKNKGITIHHLYGNDLKDIEIALPSKPEQIRIATILSDMDSEIDALEKKLSKTKELKQGLMQQLLTGKIRLA